MDLLLGLLTGGAGGLLGTLGQAVLSWYKRKEDHAHELAIREQDRLDAESDYELSLRQMQLEAELGMQRVKLEGEQARELAEVEGATAREVAAQESLQASYEHDKATYGGGFVDTLRGLVRPLVTLANMAILLTLAVLCYRQLQGELSSEVARQVITTFLGLATLTITWWFGGRQVDKMQGHGK